MNETSESRSNRLVLGDVDFISKLSRLLLGKKEKKKKSCST